MPLAEKSSAENAVISSNDGYTDPPVQPMRHGAVRSILRT